MYQEKIDILLFLIFSLFIHSSISFLFSFDGNDDQCYRADVQQCLEKAFQAMRIDTKREVDQLPHSIKSSSDSSREKRDSPKAIMSRGRHLCAASRPYLACFNIPGCRDEYVAHVASVVFHAIHGRVHPIQMFLAHRGYALQLCSQTCSRESRQHCQHMMTPYEQNEERGIYLELVGISRQLSAASAIAKDSTICQRFKNSLAAIVRHRSRHCGEAAKCACIDSNISAAVAHCNVGCEHILDEITTFDAIDNYASCGAKLFSFTQLCFILLMLRLLTT
uniref:Uncharacterized protein n=1 Tax=Parascaris univalens TaxID=6257 RepID=A0A915AEJ0_PARUN